MILQSSGARVIVALFLLLGLLAPARSNNDTPPFAQWGAENLETIRKDLWLPKLHLYAEHAPNKDGSLAHPSFMWGVGIQLTALAAASTVMPDRYLAETREYADAIQVYWMNHDGQEGFDALPGTEDLDRYYDDNAWLVLALAEVFEVTQDRKYLDRSAATFRFVMSGEDDKLGGGLYWREGFLASKHTCSNAPAIVGALRLYQLTGEENYLAIAKRLYAWTVSHLQDADGLYWDHIRLDGEISRRKYSYNSALMIRANCLLHRVTGEARYLDEAKRMARAAEKMWVHEDGSISDSGKFAHLLLESFLAVHAQENDPHWTGIVSRTLGYVHGNLRGPDGRYPESWNRLASGPARSESMLLNQASPARAYWMAAKAIK